MSLDSLRTDKLGGLPSKRQVIPPEGGWKDWTHYVVEVSYRSTNPIFRRILYVGFLGKPDRPLSGGYTSMVLTQSDDHNWNPEGLYFLRAVCEIEELAR